MRDYRDDSAQLSLWPRGADAGVRETVCSAPSITTVCLQSGSNGNCTYVETADTKLLVDAGITAAQVQRRLRALGKDPGELDAVLLTHDHADHARHVGVYHRKLGLPVFATAGCIASVERTG
ncbi:MAG: MBL fold metallo-hydrolase [Myxococcota bacterium]